MCTPAAVGLTDSPAGLAGWIVEKLRAWSDCGGIARSFTMDEILTNVTIYWLTGSEGSASQLHAVPRQRQQAAAVVARARHQPGAVHRVAARRALRAA